MNKTRVGVVGGLLLGASLALGQNTTGSNEPEQIFILDEFQVTAMETLAARAVPGLTPVAFSTIDSEDIAMRLASQDLPLALNVTPSVYATNAGGGAGDARINVRGFDQRNVAVMINGVPVNDMENGWVYWSNWDGIGDVASSIQLQRGMSNLNLAVPSIGGTLNILTNPAAHNAGGLAKAEVGSDGFKKVTFVGHTGTLNDKWAFSASIVRKIGDSYIDGVYTDAWAWFVGASYQVNEYNTLEFYAFGAPQKHGQNLYQRNIGTYSESYARGLGDYDPAALDTYYERGFAYNETWNYVNPDYDAPQYDSSGETSRHYPDIINERENFYHKPQVNLNWYYHPEADWKVDSVVYYSGGDGGGSGTLGSVARVNDPGGYFHRNRDWNYEILTNSQRIDEDGEAWSDGILRNSRNDQWTIGAVSKLTYALTESIDLSAGIDWRTAEIDHYREVRDLLGGDYYYDDNNVFWSGEERKRRLGDVLDYHFTNTVDWLGGYVQGAYDEGPLSGFVMAGYSEIKYGYENFFSEDPMNAGQTLKADSGWIDGFQVKGGLMYRITRSLNVYGNAGYVEKVPIFDAVIDDYAGQKYEDPRNEKFESYELGINYLNEKGTLSVGANIYRTTWKDRTFTQGFTDPETEIDYLVSLGGVNQVHQGFELEAWMMVTDWLRFDVAVSFNDWTYDGDVSAIYRPEGSESTGEFDLYIDGLKVGDAPQTQFVFITTLTPWQGFSGELIGRYNTDFYAAFDPLGRTDPDDRAQSWQIPSYWVWDLHLNYTLPLSTDFEVAVFLHVLNLFDETYIQEATDNDAFNSFDGDHDADDAAVFFGAPRRFNAGVSFTF